MISSGIIHSYLMLVSLVSVANDLSVTMDFCNNGFASCSHCVCREAAAALLFHTHLLIPASVWNTPGSWWRERAGAGGNTQPLLKPLLRHGMCHIRPGATGLSESHGPAQPRAALHAICQRVGGRIKSSCLNSCRKNVSSFFIAITQVGFYFFVTKVLM